VDESFVLGLPTPEVYKFSYRWVFLRARIRSEVSLVVFCIRNHRGLLTSKLSSCSRVQEVSGMGWWWGWGGVGVRVSRRSCKFHALLNGSVAGWQGTRFFTESAPNTARRLSWLGRPRTCITRMPLSRV